MTQDTGHSKIVSSLADSSKHEHNLNRYKDTSYTCIGHTGDTCQQTQEKHNLVHKNTHNHKVTY